MRNDIVWRWCYGITMRDYVFTNNHGKVAERTGYSPQAADEFGAYLNHRG